MFCRLGQLSTALIWASGRQLHALLHLCTQEPCCCLPFEYLPTVPGGISGQLNWEPKGAGNSSSRKGLHLAVIEVLPACTHPAESLNAQSRVKHSLCYHGLLRHHLPLLPPLAINISHWPSMCCWVKYMRRLTTVSWNTYSDERRRSWGGWFCGYLRKELGTVQEEKAHLHGVSHHQQCLASSSVFLEVTVLLTSCSVCSIPKDPTFGRERGKKRSFHRKASACSSETAVQGGFRAVLPSLACAHSLGTVWLAVCPWTELQGEASCADQEMKPCLEGL